MASTNLAVRGSGGGKGKKNNQGDDRTNKDKFCKKCHSWTWHDSKGCPDDIGESSEALTSKTKFKTAGPAAGPAAGSSHQFQPSDQAKTKGKFPDPGVGSSNQSQYSARSTTKGTPTHYSAAQPITQPETWEDRLPLAVNAPYHSTVTPGPCVDSQEQNQRAIAEFQRRHPESQAFIHCGRPGFGTENTIWVLANYFAMKLPKSKLHIYNFQGVPQSMTRSKKRRLLQQVIDCWPFLANQSEYWATDYASRIVASRDLSSIDGHNPMSPGQSSDAPILQYFTAGSNIPHQLAVRLQYTGTLDPAHYIAFLAGQAPEAEVAALSQALNLIMAKHPNTLDTNGQTDIVQVGGNKFFYKSGWSTLTAGLVAYRGYFSSVRPGMCRVLFNVNKVTTAFFEPDYVHRFIMKWLNIGPQGERDLYEHEFGEVEQILRGVKVRIMYNRSDQKGADIDRESRRTKTVMGVGRPLRSQEFLKEGREVLVRDYLKASKLGKHYNVHLISH